MARRAPSSNWSAALRALLPQARELAEAELKDAGHAGGAAARLDRAIQLRQVVRPTRSCSRSDRPRAARAPMTQALAKDDGPGHERGEQQDADDDLHRHAGLRDEANNRQLITHSPSSPPPVMADSREIPAAASAAGCAHRRRRRARSPPTSSCGAQPAAPPRRMLLREAHRGRALGRGSQVMTSSSSSRAGRAVVDLQAHHREQDPRVAPPAALLRVTARRAAIRCAPARGSAGSWRSRRCRRRPYLPSRRVPAT